MYLYIFHIENNSHFKNPQKEISFPASLKKCSQKGELKMAQKVLVGQNSQKEFDMVSCAVKCAFSEKKYVKDGKVDEEYIKNLSKDLTDAQKNLINNAVSACKDVVPGYPSGECSEYTEVVRCIQTKLLASEKLLIALGISMMAYY